MANKKLLVLFFLFSILTSIFCENKLYFYDNAKVVTEEEYNKINTAVQSLLQIGEVAVVINPSDNTYDCETWEKAKDLSVELFGDRSSIVFLLDLSVNIVIMEPSGKFAEYVNSDQAYDIITEVCDELSSKMQNEDVFYYEYALLAFEKITKRIEFLKTPVQTVSVSENNNRLYILDNAKLLTQEQIQLLQHDMEPILQYGNIGFVTNPVDAPYSGEASEEAGILCRQIFGGLPATLLFIDMYNRRIEIYSIGHMYNTINTTRANIIATNTYQYATDEDYYTCASQCFKQMAQIFDGNEITTPLRYVSNFLIAFGLALLILFLYIYLSRKHSSIGKNVAIVEEEDAKSAVKILECKMTKQTKTRHSSSSGGGGGHGGGGGGGGGHSF